MKSLKVSFAQRGESSIGLELQRLEKEKGLKATAVAKAIAEKLGTDVRTEAALYRFFRRGERRISDSRMDIIVEVLGASKDELVRLNNLFDLENVTLSFDPSLDLTEILKNVPTDALTLGKFLIWLSTDLERQRLLGLLPK